MPLRSQVKAARQGTGTAEPTSLQFDVPGSPNFSPHIQELLSMAKVQNTSEATSALNQILKLAWIYNDVEREEKEKTPKGRGRVPGSLFVQLRNSIKKMQQLLRRLEQYPRSRHIAFDMCMVGEGTIGVETEQALKKGATLTIHTSPEWRWSTNECPNFWAKFCRAGSLDSLRRRSSYSSASANIHKWPTSSMPPTSACRKTIMRPRLAWITAARSWRHAKANPKQQAVTPHRMIAIINRERVLDSLLRDSRRLAPSKKKGGQEKSIKRAIVAYAASFIRTYSPLDTTQYAGGDYGEFCAMFYGIVTGKVITPSDIATQIRAEAENPTDWS